MSNVFTSLNPKQFGIVKLPLIDLEAEIANKGEAN